MFVEGAKTKRLLSVSAMAGIAGRIDYSGDNGPATAALNNPVSVAIDTVGDMPIYAIIALVRGWLCCKSRYRHA